MVKTKSRPWFHQPEKSHNYATLTQQRLKHVWTRLRRVKPMSPPGENRCAAWRRTLVYENSIGFSDIIILQFLILLIHLWRLVVACLYFITHGYSVTVCKYSIFFVAFFAQIAVLENSRHLLNHLTKELKQTTTWSLPFSCSLDSLVFT